MKNNILLDSYKLSKNCELKNRIVMAPMTRKINEFGIMNSDNSNYYVRRVEGGVGLIISEGIVVNNKSASNDINLPNFYTEDSIESWNKIVNDVHKHNGKIFAQIWHVGSDRKKDNSPFSDIDNVNVNSNYESIKNVIKAFGDTAKIAQEIGFDGIEIHAAHGYFIDEFLWNKKNKRDDIYGGKSIEERNEILRQIIFDIKEKTVDNFPIGLRISQWKTTDFEAKLFKSSNDIRKFVNSLPNNLITYYHVSTRRYWEPAFSNSDLTLAGWFKKISGKTTIAVGSVGLNNDFLNAVVSGKGASKTNLFDLEKMMEKHEFDLIALGRTLISNPNFVKIIENNDFSLIKDFDANDLNTLN